MARDDLTWFEINDFRPGIREIGSLPLGSCSDDTWGCIAAETGELKPLPGPSYVYTPTPPDNFVNVSNGDYWVNGFHVTGPLTGAAVGSGNQIEFHLGWEWIQNAGAPNPHREYRWERHQIFANPVVIDTLHTHSSTIANPSASTRGTFFEDVRMDPTVATNPGVPLVAAAWYEEGGGGHKFVHVYPNPSTPSVNSLTNISSTLPCDIIVAHQGRLVMFEQRGWSHGSPGSWISNEQIWYTNINLPTIEPSVAATFATDRMTGIGVAKSVSSSEFLIVKFDEGAYAVAGDFSNPTVIRLPGVAPTYGATTIPVYTPLGLVYGQLNGSVFAWGGGDTSINLAPQLDDGFWVHPNHGRWVNYNGSFSLWKERIVTPNGWLMDAKTGGWWRLNDINDTRQYLHTGTSYGGGLYCAFDFVNVSGQAVVHGYSTTLRSSYEWDGNQIPALSNDRRVEFRELLLDAQGEGTITITLSAGVSLEGSGSISIPTIAARKRYLKAVRFQTQGNVAVKIEASGASGGTAPTVHSLKLGHTERAAFAAA